MQPYGYSMTIKHYQLVLYLEEDNLVIFVEALEARQVFGILDDEPRHQYCHLDHVHEDGVGHVRRLHRFRDIHLLEGQRYILIIDVTKTN